MLQARIKNLIERNKNKNKDVIAADNSAEMTLLRSSNVSNQPMHRTMSISMIASLIYKNHADVRSVANDIIVAQKFNTLPQLVSREEIDRKVLDDNETLLFVGFRDLPKKRFHSAIDAETRAKNFKLGTDYLVNGILGPAVYAVQAIRDPKAKDNDESAIQHAYEEAVEYSKTQNKKGIVLRMTLKSDARVITYIDFMKLLQVNNAQIRAELDNYLGFEKYLNIFLNTPSLIAIAQGYDAIVQIPDGSVVILNRGALRIQKTNATSKNAMYAQVQMEIDAKIQEEKEKQEAAEKKKREQLKRQRELQARQQEQQKKIEEEKQMHPQLQAQSQKSARLWYFDSDVVARVVNNSTLTTSEKNEIIDFISLYNQSSESTKEMLSKRLKEMLSL
jgi:hypothetical protein